jgi:hypothetical protein
MYRSQTCRQSDRAGIEGGCGLGERFAPLAVPRAECSHCGQSSQWPTMGRAATTEMRGLRTPHDLRIGAHHLLHFVSRNTTPPPYTHNKTPSSPRSHQLHITTPSTTTPRSPGAQEPRSPGAQEPRSPEAQKPAAVLFAANCVNSNQKYNDRSTVNRLRPIRIRFRPAGTCLWLTTSTAIHRSPS